MTMLQNGNFAPFHQPGDLAPESPMVGNSRMISSRARARARARVREAGSKPEPEMEILHLSISRVTSLQKVPWSEILE